MVGRKKSLGNAVLDGNSHLLFSRNGRVRITLYYEAGPSVYINYMILFIQEITQRTRVYATMPRAFAYIRTMYVYIYIF